MQQMAAKRVHGMLQHSHGDARLVTGRANLGSYRCGLLHRPTASHIDDYQECKTTDEYSCSMQLVGRGKVARPVSCVLFELLYVSRFVQHDVRSERDSHMRVHKRRRVVR